MTSPKNSTAIVSYPTTYAEIDKMLPTKREPLIARVREMFKMMISVDHEYYSSEFRMYVLGYLAGRNGTAHFSMSGSAQFDLFHATLILKDGLRETFINISDCSEKELAEVVGKLAREMPIYSTQPADTPMAAE